MKTIIISYLLFFLRIESYLSVTHPVDAWNWPEYILIILLLILFRVVPNSFLGKLFFRNFKIRVFLLASIVIISPFLLMQCHHRQSFCCVTYPTKPWEPQRISSVKQHFSKSSTHTPKYVSAFFPADCRSYAADVLGSAFRTQLITSCSFFHVSPSKYSPSLPLI
jgi:hypothetical protein